MTDKSKLLKTTFRMTAAAVTGLTGAFFVMAGVSAVFVSTSDCETLDQATRVAASLLYLICGAGDLKMANYLWNRIRPLNKTPPMVTDKFKAVVVGAVGSLMANVAFAELVTTVARPNVTDCSPSSLAWKPFISTVCLIAGLGSTAASRQIYLGPARPENKKPSFADSQSKITL